MNHIDKTSVIRIETKCMRKEIEIEYDIQTKNGELPNTKANKEIIWK